MRRFLFLLTVALCAAFPSLTPAQVLQIATPLTSLPTTIRHPGIYVLRKDLNFKLATGAAITIAPDNVVLDLGGHTLTNTLAANMTGPTQAIGVTSTEHIGLTVRNGQIDGFNDGVNINSGSTIGTVTAGHLQIDDCHRVGITIAADQVEVLECRMRNIGAAAAPNNVWGIEVRGSSLHVMGNEVYGMTSAASPARGIQVASSALGVIERNRVINNTLINGSFGIILFNNQSAFGGNIATGNFVANWATGITFSNGSPGKYKDNLTENCTTAFQGGTAAGTND